MPGAGARRLLVASATSLAAVTGALAFNRGDVASGVAATALIGGGAVLVCGHGVRSPGWVLVAASVAWSLGDLAAAGGAVGAVGAVAVTLHRGPLAHAVLASPEGRLRRGARAVAVVAWIDGAILAVARSAPLTLALAAGLAAIGAIGAWIRAGRGRRSAVLGGAACGLLALALGLPAALRLAGAPPSPHVLPAYEFAVAGVAVLVTVAARLRRAGSVAGLVIDLGDRPDGATLRRALAGALGDPGLELAWWVPAEQCYVDESGAPVDVRRDGGRAVTVLKDGGERLGAVLHDPAVLDDPALVAAAAATARVAVENARAHARAQEQARALADARRRLLEAGDAQRRRLRGELADGAERDLSAVAVALEAAAAAGAPLGESAAELAEARAELASLALGILPARGAREDLADALAAQVARCPLPVELDLEAVDVPAPIAGALWFVASEGLANAVKHADAGRLRVRLTQDQRGVMLEVSDDGQGGADPRGTGLQGVTDRVEALGGALSVVALAGGGTVVRATFEAAGVAGARA